MQQTPKNLSCFQALAWFNIAYLFFVIAWGAFVRASGSGAGCGEHWPLCNGQVVPQDPSFETMIEFGHRITSGLSLVFMGLLVYFAFKLFGKGHAVRQGAVLSAVFLIIEALIGAALVLLALVDHGDTRLNLNSSPIRLTTTRRRL